MPPRRLATLGPAVRLAGLLLFFLAELMIVISRLMTHIKRVSLMMEGLMTGVSWEEVSKREKNDKIKRKQSENQIKLMRRVLRGKQVMNSL